MHRPESTLPAVGLYGRCPNGLLEKMLHDRTFATATVAFGSGAIVHAFLTWPLPATIALFAGGAIVAFVGEAIVIHLGWLDHHIGPTVAGVPLYVLVGWTGVVYVAFRLALVPLDGWPAVVGAAVIATVYDLLTDHYGVAAGYWSYTGGPPGPRVRSVPWWNFLGWVVISSVTAAITLPFL